MELGFREGSENKKNISIKGRPTLNIFSWSFPYLFLMRPPCNVMVVDGLTTITETVCYSEFLPLLIFTWDIS